MNVNQSNRKKFTTGKRKKKCTCIIGLNRSDLLLIELPIRSISMMWWVPSIWMSSVLNNHCCKSVFFVWNWSTILKVKLSEWVNDMKVKICVKFYTLTWNGALRHTSSLKCNILIGKFFILTKKVEFLSTKFRFICSKQNSISNSYCSTFAMHRHC